MSPDHRGRLSPGERALWFLQRKAPASGAYNLAGALRIGHLETAALRRALVRLVARHAALRTTYPADPAAGGEPRRRVHPALEPDVTAEDADGEPAALRRRLEEEAVRPFDLAAGPLLRVRIIAAPDGERAVLFVFHHLIADFWSLALALRELGMLYGEETGGPAAVLPPVSPSYADWAAERERRLAAPRGERLQAFWRQRLAGPPPVLGLPVDRPRPPVASGAGEERSRRLAPAPTARLASLARARGATLFAVLLAGFQLLLHRVSGEEDVWIGVPTAGRSAARWAGTMGYFVSPVVMRGRLAGAPTFTALVDGARDEAREALAHRDWPFPPPFQAMLTVHRTRRPEEEALALLALGEGGGRLRLEGFDLETLPLRHRAAQLDLALAAAVVDGELRLTLTADADLFDGTAAERLLGQIAVLLTAAGEAPETPAGALPLLAAAERQAVLVEHNDTRTVYPRETCLHELVMAQAEKTPEAVAASCGDGVLTYRGLVRRARRLAAHLTAVDVAADGRVGVLLERSLEMIVGILGVLEAGAAYVPLEPTLPAERLGLLAESAGLSAVVTCEKHAGLLPAGGVRRVLLDAAWPAIETRPAVRAGEDNLAYVLYTSGSTGAPKGVMISHRGIVNRLLWMQEAYGLTAADRVLQKTPFGFDVSVWELFWPLVTGARLVFAPPGEHREPRALAELIARQGITTLHFVPSMLEAFLAAAGPEPLPSLRRVMASGETLTAPLVRRFFARFGRSATTELHNLYGPTEASVDVSVWPCVPEPPGSLVPIGRPIANHALYVVDPRLGAQPIGVPGELLVGGPGLARGYLGRADLTAAVFIPDPFGAGPGGRLYRTGDRARRLPDGNVQYLGRRDRQVKIRGFRIELGEIEAALARQPGVREAVVLVREDASGDQPGDERLVAYVVASPEPTGGAAPSPTSLQDALRRTLPAAMVPAVSDFVILESLPLSANGKVDRRALSRIAPVREAARFPAPQGPLEEMLAAIWAAVLGAARLGGDERVGAHDDFFALGGHSLLATQVLSRVRDACGVDLPVSALFEAPTVAALAARVRAARPGGAPPLARDPRLAGVPAPLSFAQERFWLVDRLEPGSPAYHLAGAARLRGPLDAMALWRAFGEVVGRHEILRTRYAAPLSDWTQSWAGEPVAVVDPAAPVDFPLIDLAGLPAGVQQAEADLLAVALARRPFDLARGPVLRVLLLRLAAEEHDLLLAIHHIAADGASVDLFFRELAGLVRRPGSLPGLPLQYADFARWQRAWLTPEVLAPHAAWWSAELAGAPAGLDLTPDRSRPSPAATAPSGVRRLRFTPPQELAALRRRSGATFFMLIAAGFLALLGRLTGQGDVLVGTPVSERGRRELEPLLGCLINTLLLRGRMADDPPFEVFLRRTRSACLAAWEHQELPFERLAERPPFEAFVETPPEREVSLPLGEASGPLREVETGAAKFDLTLTVEDAGPELRAALRYRSDRFDGTTAERLLASFSAFLAGAAADSAARLGDLPLLTGTERRQVLVEWGEGPPARRPAAAVPAAFAALAAAAPDEPAVLFADRVVRTRGELSRRAARIAAALAEAGAGPGVVVGLCLDRAPDLVEAVLGVLAAGAAYLPLDPAYPPAYLAHVLEDSAAPLVVTRHALRTALPALPGSVLVLSDVECRELGPTLADLPAVDLDAAAYLLYTSGSTGRPKGITVSHRSLAVYLSWVLEGPLAGIDGLPFATSLSFDASLPQLFGPLLGGFPVRLVDEETARRPERLLPLLRGPGRFAFNCVPSLWREMLVLLEARRAAGEDRPEPGLVRLLLGGEGFDRGLLERTVRLLPAVEVWNLYGPTEATGNAAVSQLVSGEEVSIGHPIRGAQLRVVDRLLRPLPPGIAGELAIGGTGVARGYWRRPALSAERFVPDPFAAVPGARLYRTGDRARFRADGAVEVLGRIDRQLKVRGLRVEPAEIEAALLTHPAVADCAVGTDVRGDRLIAWVVPRPAAGWQAGALRLHLAGRLPAGMVPAAFLAVAALPRTPAGKLDRAALAAQAPALAAGSGSAPRTPAEEILAGLWAEMLGVAEVGLDDDFFARGGHSLLAARLLARVRQVLGVDLPLRALFAAPTVAGLAAAVAAARRDAAAEPAPPVARAPRDGLLPLSFAQERLWFLDQWMPDSPAYTIAAAVRLEGRLDAGALAAALAAIVRRHEALRTTFTAAGGRPVQIVHETAGVPLPVVDLAGLGAAAREGSAAALAAAEARRPFELARGPLLRTRLLRLAAGEHVLVVCLHHIVADGWSLGILIAELGALYGAPSSPLPALAVQYADFAVWQRRLAEGEAAARDLAWWRAFLAGAPAGIDLPTDRPRPPWSIHRGALAPFCLDPPLTGRLRAVARSSDATLFMALLAAFQAVLARFAAAEDLVVGAAVDQRTPEVEGLIGLFVNLLAMRADLSGDPSFSVLLARTRGASLDAYEHRDLPFERLVSALEPARHPGRNPVFQVAFSLQSAGLPEAALPGLAVAVTALDTGTSRFDLTLLLREEGGGLAGSLEHSTELFDSATIERLLAGFRNGLAAVAADTGLPLSRLPLLAPGERRQIVEAWALSEGEDATLPGACVHELFARQEARAPDSVAVVAGDEEITYRELDRRAAALARRLRRLGVGPDVPVALCLERSPEMVVGMLGILQAGGAYVPLDLGYPRERLAWMLADSGARIAVGIDPGAAGLRVVDLDARDEAEPAPPPGVDADNLAYIVYTSGSTGRPKGVAATHRGVVGLVAAPRYAELGPRETILQLAPTSFDASTFEVWGALLHGGRLALPPPGPVALHELGAALRRHRVTTLFLTTGLFHQMIDEEAACLAGLRQLLFGGDSVSVARVRRALDLLPHVRLIHAYGPTEATTFAICRTVTAADAARATVTLGRPIAGTAVHILDSGLEPVPPGVPGELYLGGGRLARGYHGRPELTAERFVASPFGEPGSRLYRTGDRARWLPGGAVEFLGRIDRQVKIRGFRVEPAEVEAALEGHPGIASCVVMPRGEAEARRLVAWVVPAADSAPDEGELLAWCRERLPPFLVPGAFVRVRSMPLDPNGKVDRRALPEPDGPCLAAGFVAPRTPLEEQVAAIWAEVLGLERVGAEDDFFALGGHSLLATRIVSRLARDIGVEVGLRALFEEPTVRGVAVAITREQIRQGDPERMANLLARVQGLSPEELADLLRENLD